MSLPKPVFPLNSYPPHPPPTRTQVQPAPFSLLQALELHGGGQWGGNSLSCTHLSRCLNQTFRGCPGRGPSDTSVQCTAHLQPLAHFFFKQVSSTYMVLAFADPQATETSKAQCLPLRDAAHPGRQRDRRRPLSSQRQMEDRALGRLRDAP